MSVKSIIMIDAMSDQEILKQEAQYKEFRDSIYLPVSQLRYIKIDREKKNDLHELKKAYRGVFGLKYQENENEIIAEDVRRDIFVKDGDRIERKEDDSDHSFYEFLVKRHCCWIDFIGCDSFSGKNKKQIFFSTVSMEEKDVDRRKVFLQEYQRLLDERQLPVDVFVQLFFVDPDENFNWVKTDFKEELIKKLKDIQTKGLVIKFVNSDENTNEFNESIVSTMILCPDPVSKVDDLSFDKLQKTTLNEEIVNFLMHVISNQSISPLLTSVARLNRALHEEVKYLYFLPMHSAESAIGLYCYGAKELLSWEERRELLVFANGFLSPYVSIYKSTWESQQVTKEAIRSAVAALMARNMSHNLGSHYLTNTKNYFKNRVQEVIRGELSKDIMAADYRGNSHMLQYIQERMDFIATVVSGDIYPWGSLNVKAEFFDILTNDDCGARHSNDKTHNYEKNFLLQYLLYSEHLTRRHFFDEGQSDFPEVNLVIKYNNEKYTGKAKEKDSENAQKLALSRLRLAVPGGIMARHAIFSLVENILRNSAKHNKLSSDKGLTLTIEIEKTDDDLYRISFYDDCRSANNEIELKNDAANTNQNSITKMRLVDLIRQKLDNIFIVGDDGIINKHDKGLKEMLFCAIWLQNKNLAQTLFDIQYKIIEKGKQKHKASDFLEVSEKDGNLCYSICLAPFKNSHYIKSKIKSPAELLDIHADFVIANDDYKVGEGRCLSEIYPRFLRIGKSDEKEGKPAINTDEVIKETCKELTDQYNIVIEYPIRTTEKLPSGVFHRNDLEWTKNGKKTICFYDHLLNAGKENDMKEAEGNDRIVYFDSISGENFTSTLINPVLLEDEVFRYKVVLSAITRIAIVDERIWMNYHANKPKLSSEEEGKNTGIRNVIHQCQENVPWRDMYDTIKQLDYSLWNNLNDYLTSSKINPDDNTLVNKRIKEFLEINQPRLVESDSICRLIKGRNISVFNLDKEGRLIDLNDAICDSVHCDFVSFHLGAIDKLPEGIDFNDILKYFKVDGSCPFVSIHSGRGNFSPDLEEKLKDYPFISLSALESSLNNSKYMLSEFLYNTNYYGKGNINHK